MSRPFAPDKAGSTVNLSVTTTSAAVQFDNISGNGLKNPNVRLFNGGAATVFVNWGGAAVTASATTGFPLAAGASVVLHLGGASYVAAVTASGTSTLYATPGEGGC